MNHVTHPAPLLSVVTITYNDPKGLARTLKSVQPMLFVGIQWEHIVIDSSPELSEPILNELKQPRWPLIHISTPPAGTYSAMNSGIRASRGKYIWFLNGGDVLKNPIHLKELLTELETVTEPVIACAAGEIYRDGKLLYPKVARGSLMSSILGRNRLCHQAVIYRREIFEKTGMFREDFALVSDYDHYFRCLHSNVAYITSPRILVECDGSGVSNSQWMKSLREQWQMSFQMVRKFSPFFNLAHFFILGLESLRVLIIKSISRLPATGLLQKSFHLWNRAHSWALLKMTGQSIPSDLKIEKLKKNHSANRNSNSEDAENPY